MYVFLVKSIIFLLFYSQGDTEKFTTIESFNAVWGGSYYGGENRIRKRIHIK